MCQAARLDEIGWDRDLTLDFGPDDPPAPIGEEVLVRVEACGVCFRDLIDREGRIPFIRTPIVPGHEVCGRVVAVGPDVHDWKAGDRVGTMHRDACGMCTACRAGHTSLCVAAAHVLGLMADGGYARFVTMPESGLFALPDGLQAAQAAVLHCTFGTAWRSMVTVGGLRAGENVLVTGANGGVGSAAVQIAARFAKEVVAVVRDAAHVPFVESLGATRVIVSADGQFHKAGLPPIDLAIENVGSATFNASLRSLTVGGRLAIVGNVDATRVELNLGLLVVKGLKILGAGGATRSDMAAMLTEHARVPFTIAIDRAWPLTRADEAQRAVRLGGLHGRIVLLP